MYFNAEAMLYKSINDPYIKFDVSSSAKKKSDEFHLRKTMRFCDFGRLAKYNMIFQMISDALGNTTNIPFRCPLNADHYYIRNFRLEASVFPYQLFYSRKTSIYFQAKVYSKERSKLLEVVYTNSKFAIEKRCWRMDLVSNVVNVTVSKKESILQLLFCENNYKLFHERYFLIFFLSQWLFTFE